MEKNKISYLILLFLLILFIGCNRSDSKNYLTIKNVGTEIISDVKIEYSDGSQTYLGNLYPSCDYKYKFLNSANESAISLLYTDINNQVHKIMIVPYLILAENKNYQYSIR